jgi:hypothetical protein
MPDERGKKYRIQYLEVRNEMVYSVIALLYEIDDGRVKNFCNFLLILYHVILCCEYCFSKKQLPAVGFSLLFQPTFTGAAK